MRWTFRRLLTLNLALPIMIVLRELARRWQDSQCQGEARSLDAFLDDWVMAELGGGWKDCLGQFVASPDGPRPVLLVDGWDELGPLGEELRRKLVGFMNEHPRVLVVVTSRPYGEGRPSHSDGFDEVLDLQPLSNDEIEDLARRFFKICYGEAEQTAKDEANRLMKALERSPEALALARTALLLTMMLLISRSRPLPDKRHLLYEACIENLLHALPERRESDGVLTSEDQWRPRDSEERMRIVAALAFRLQSEGYQKSSRSAIIRTWEEMAGMLPEPWPESDKMRFLRWLAGPAGLLVDPRMERLPLLTSVFKST